MYERSLGVCDLPLDARRRAESFIAEGQYYGWKLLSVEAKSMGDRWLYTMNFDSTRIMFLGQPAQAVRWALPCC